MRWTNSLTVNLLGLPLVFLVATAFSCVKEDFYVSELEPAPITFELDTTVLSVKPSEDPRPEPVNLDGKVTVTTYANLGFKHQSAAVYGDYAFFVRVGRSEIRLFDMVAKRRIYSFLPKAESNDIYHSNQSTFGTEKYEPGDYFPLLYISQRARSENRCLTEVYRIVPLFNADSTALIAFRAELVQEIFFPPMTAENSMGNVNCVIDPWTGKMYTYSRNNDSKGANYLQCRISRFSVPDIHLREVYLEDADIENSFPIDARATNMQGGCIVDGRLYIGQGYPYANYVYLNVVDLHEERLVKRYDLLAKGVDWEPEGCFYYDGNVMLAHTDGICRIEEEEYR